MANGTHISKAVLYTNVYPNVIVHIYREREKERERERERERKVMYCGKMI